MTSMSFNLTPSQARGSRLKLLRELSKLSRDQFAQRYHIAVDTLKNWENANFGGLTEKGARHMLSIFRGMGMEVNIQWLLYGEGEAPLFSLTNQNSRLDDMRKYRLSVYEKQLQAEFELFARHTSQAVRATVVDDAMSPRFHCGDVVAGSRMTGDRIELLDDKDCIVQLLDGRVTVRRLQATSTTGLYNLIHVNVYSRVEYASMYHVQLLSAAAVIWIRAPMADC